MRRLAPLLFVMTACAGSGIAGSGDDGASARPSTVLPVSIPNGGGDLEGHGPRGFAGQGIGLFAGDELNENFPAGDGIQIWLTFDLPLIVGVDRALLHSDRLSVSGDPFDSLGELRVERVDYAAFEPESFDLPARSDLAACASDVDAGTFECDVTELVSSVLADGEERVQLRLKFDELSDGDGEPDLARFFLTDSNTNERGIFTLAIS